MDWSKAKTILITAFFLLNIFLFIMIILTNSGGIFQSDYITHAQNFLASKDIKINADIPKTTGLVGKVLYSVKEYDPLILSRLVFGFSVPASIEKGNTFKIEYESEMIELTEDELIIVDKLNKGANFFNNTKMFEKELYKYLNKLGFKKLDLLDRETEEFGNEKKFIYTVKYKNSLIFDLQISVKLSNEGVMTLSLPTKEVNKQNGQSEILSAYQLVVTAGLPSGVTIEAVDFGYKQVFEGDLYGNPVWRVILNNGDILYYNAYTGELLN